MEDDSLIAQNVRRLMKARRIGAKALSLKAGLNETYVRDLLKGKSRNPRHEHLQKLAIALDSHMSDLTGELDELSAFKKALLAEVDGISSQRDRETLLRVAQSMRHDDSDPPPHLPDNHPRPSHGTGRASGH